MKRELSSKFIQDDRGVWVPKNDVRAFGYSDGRWVEKYLEYVFNTVSDLSSGSEELERYIKDWNTEYHLTRKRKDLLAGLNHNRNAKVLEIGCGCGAITRFLGEQYDSVVAVEGSYERARLARQRTSDLENVEVIASRYQDTGLEGEFDIVFCIGVLEYAPTYVDALDPFAHALQSMKRMLKPNGALVIAIENKLGLKYFANSREDHAGTFFEGIEGYPRTSDKFKTFGRLEFKKLLESYWDNTDFYYPFPDYKIPAALISDAGTEVLDTGELVGSLDERDYAGKIKPFFDTKLAWPEIASNGLVGELSNSFLVVAGSEGDLAPSFTDRLAVLFNRDRLPRFSTETYIERRGDSIVARKMTQSGKEEVAGKVSVRPTTTEWLERKTVAFVLFRNAHSRFISADNQIEPIKIWWEKILAMSSETDDGLFLNGDMVDAVWHNCSVMPNGSVEFFDQELVWHQEIRPVDLFLRSAIQWTARYAKPGMPNFSNARKIRIVKQLGDKLNISFSSVDVARVIEMEGVLQSQLGMVSKSRSTQKIKFMLFMPYADEIIFIIERVALQSRRARNLLRRLIGR